MEGSMSRSPLFSPIDLNSPEYENPISDSLTNGKLRCLVGK